MRVQSANFVPAMIYTFSELVFSASLAVFIAVSLSIAAVRWGHRCEPYARHMDYYFPAWKVVVFSFLTCLVLIPSVFLPKEADAVLHVRMMLMLSSFYFSSMILFSYFGKVLKVNWWRRPIYALSVPFGIMILSGCAFTLIPGTQLEGAFCRFYFSVGGILAIIFLLCFAMAVRMIARAILRVSQENYSNPEDFPQRYAIHVIWIPFTHVAVSWLIVYIGSLEVLSGGMLILSIINVAFIIGALSPHRAKDVRLFESEAQASEPVVEEAGISQEFKDELVRTIRHHVEDEQAYLDCHLTLASLSRSCGANRTYVSQVLGERLGGFFLYVNRCRMAHAARYRLDNPNASVEDVAIASGFGSRQSYYNVRKQLENK